MTPPPAQFQQVTVICQANIYFDGKVVSHSLIFPDGSRKTLGLIYPGSYHFGTEAAEIMQITSGSCRVKPDGESHWVEQVQGSEFQIPAQSGFDICVESGICQYICSFVK